MFWDIVNYIMSSEKSVSFYHTCILMYRRLGMYWDQLCKYTEMLGEVPVERFVGLDTESGRSGVATGGWGGARQH